MAGILTVNAGSSTLKLRLLDEDDRLVASEEVSLDDAADKALAKALADWDTPDAIGHRVVHGGSRFTSPVRLAPDVRRYLDGTVDLAPVHQPGSLRGIDLVAEALPGVPAVLCFDTAFHATMPAVASTYAIPAEWRDRGVRRYGFHGLSYAYAARRTVRLLGRTSPVGLRVVVAHLGAGASIAAIADGQSVDTTMGFTPLEGLVMATRSGDVDPGALTYLVREGLTDARGLDEILNTRSGLTGLAGDADMREVLVRATGGDEDARLAIGVYVHRLRAGVAAMVASLGGMDALVFTGGVGEGSATIRARCVGGLGHLGVAIDPVRNASATPDVELTTPDARVRVLVVHAREDLQIASEVRQVLGLA